MNWYMNEVRLRVTLAAIQLAVVRQAAPLGGNLSDAGQQTHPLSMGKHEKMSSSTQACIKVTMLSSHHRSLITVATGRPLRITRGRPLLVTLVHQPGGHTHDAA
jgi:hypothetical protein